MTTSFAHYNLENIAGIAKKQQMNITKEENRPRAVHVLNTVSIMLSM
jgi:hypothetical protein